MNNGGTILLWVILFILVSVLLLWLRGVSWGQNAKRHAEERDDERYALKSLGEGQRTIASTLISIQADIVEIRNRLAALERSGKNGQ